MGFLTPSSSGVDLVLEFFEDAWDTVIGWFGADTDDDDAPRISRPAVLEILKRLLIEFNSGSVLSTACLRTFRTADVMLSSAVNHHPGQISFQKQTCIAVIGQNASVWTTKPMGEASTAAGLGRGLVNLVETTPLQWATTMAFPWANRPYDGLANVALPFLKDAALPVGHDGPNWWTGTVTLPRRLAGGQCCRPTVQTRRYPADAFEKHHARVVPEGRFRPDPMGAFR